MGETQDYFKGKATEQNNQLRIALISISVGLCAFFAKELNSSLTSSQYPYLYLTVISSLLASVSGLLAWKCSARMFYALGQGKIKEERLSKSIWHGFKVFLI
jgi:hypothetical protein